MTAITLYLPDDLAARLAALPDEQVNAYAVAALSDLAAADEKADEEAVVAEELTPEDLAAIGRGLAALDAGQVTPGPVAFAELRAHLAELKRAKRGTKQQRTKQRRIEQQAAAA